jgi:hypothetical protein
MLIVRRHLHLDFPSSFFLSGSPTSPLTYLIPFIGVGYPLFLLEFDHLNAIWWRVQIMNLLLIQVSPTTLRSSLLNPNSSDIQCNEPFIKHSKFGLRDYVLGTCKAKSIIMVLCRAYYIITFLNSTWEEKKHSEQNHALNILLKWKFTRLSSQRRAIVSSKGFWRWFISLRIAGFLEFVHLPVF